MLVLPHFRHYERPEGWTSGDPNVLVARPVYESQNLGMPAVDYESLSQLFQDDLRIPRDVRTDVMLYGNDRFNNSKRATRLYGFHAPLSSRVHVNAGKSEDGMRFGGGVMEVLAHEALHRADSHNRKLVTMGEVAERTVVFLGVKSAIEQTPVPDGAEIFLPGLAVYLALQARRLHYMKIDRAEKRARAFADSPVAQTHFNNILFPYASRTGMAIHRGQVPHEQIDQLKKNGYEGYCL